jgi:hypothetical protein
MIETSGNSIFKQSKTTVFLEDDEQDGTDLQGKMKPGSKNQKNYKEGSEKMIEEVYSSDDTVSLKSKNK